RGKLAAHRAVSLDRALQLFDAGLIDRKRLIQGGRVVTLKSTQLDHVHTLNIGDAADCSGTCRVAFDRRQSSVEVRANGSSCSGVNIGARTGGARLSPSLRH